MDDGAGCIEEVTVGTAREQPQILRQGVTGEWTRGQDGDRVSRWQ
ncbi:MAG: Uncharacterised protein [Synechococcus sp. CC9902]|nr:MAG: Uncharacterised protein [Synechococcus sp. CC9902]